MTEKPRGARPATFYERVDARSRSSLIEKALSDAGGDLRTAARRLRRTAGA